MPNDMTVRITPAGLNKQHTSWREEQVEAHGHPQELVRLLQQQQGTGKISYGTTKSASPDLQQMGQQHEPMARHEGQGMKQTRVESSNHSTEGVSPSERHWITFWQKVSGRRAGIASK